MARELDTIGRQLSALAVATALLAACGGTSPASTDPEAASGMTSAEAVTEVAAVTEAPIVGRWMQVHTCDQLVAGLEDAGLGAIAPAVVGDFFPDATPQDLAAKEDLCSGARPQRHFHFFDAAGAFGSLDQHEQQVDDGPYTAEGDTLVIGDGAWTFQISGNQLSLEPEISDAQREEALANPLEWSTAGWIVAVAYPGSTWKRVACKGWC